MLRALLVLAGLAGLVWWSRRLLAAAWRERAHPLPALWHFALAYLVSSVSLVLIARMLEWSPLIRASRLYAWPLVQFGEAYAEAVRRSLPPSLTALALIASGLAAAALLILLHRRLIAPGPIPGRS